MKTLGKLGFPALSRMRAVSGLVDQYLSKEQKFLIAQDTRCPGTQPQTHPAASEAAALSEQAAFHS